jgi:hypothetical protein
MGSIEEIGERVDQRLEVLLEESSRLRAALEALGGDGASATRRRSAGRTTTSGIETLGGNPSVKQSRGSAVTPAEPDVVDGNDATQDAAVKSALLLARVRPGRTSTASRARRRTAQRIGASAMSCEMHAQSVGPLHLCAKRGGDG